MPKYRINNIVLKNTRNIPNCDGVLSIVKNIITTGRLYELKKQQLLDLLSWLKEIEKHQKCLKTERKDFIRQQVLNMYYGKTN